MFCLNIFDTGFRRVTAEVDERNIIARKLLIKCGFQFETTLRKHKVIQNRNSNTALYVLLNSEWLEAQKNLSNVIGYKETKTVKAVGIFSFESK